MTNINPWPFMVLIILLTLKLGHEVTMAFHPMCAP